MAGEANGGGGEAEKSGREGGEGRGREEGTAECPPPSRKTFGYGLGYHPDCLCLLLHVLSDFQAHRLFHFSS